MKLGNLARSLTYTALKREVIFLSAPYWFVGLAIQSQNRGREGIRHSDVNFG